MALRLPVHDELVVFERSLYFDEDLGIFLETMGHVFFVPHHALRVVALDRKSGGHRVIADGPYGDRGILHQAGPYGGLESDAPVSG